MLLIALLALQAVTLLALIVLLVRKPQTAQEAVPDPRLEQLLAADLPSQLARLDAHFNSVDGHLRAELAQLRTDNAAASASLRGEVLTSINTLGKAITDGLDGFRADTARQSAEGRETLHTRLNEMRTAQTEHLEKLRGEVEKKLDALNTTNAAKLEEMRLTVDEKLHATLQNRLTESFGQVTDQLTKVHAGLGEMTKLSAGVDDLSRIFTNVKSRGGFAEVQLGKLLDQVLAPGQFVQNARVKENTLEVVEYAVKFPGTGGEVLLPIDAKFPREDWERLETAYEHGNAEEIEASRRAFDAAIRTEGKRICSKYINEPVTTPYAIMFLPTEGLYAEVLRRDGLQSDLHQNCRVMVAGPSNLYALLTSFQLGFRMLNLQKKGDEVWKVLARTQTEFKNFEDLMGSMEKQVGTVQNTIQKLGVRSRAINRTLRDVSVDSTAPLPAPGAGAFDGVLPILAASDDE